MSAVRIIESFRPEKDDKSRVFNRLSTIAWHLRSKKSSPTKRVVILTSTNSLELGRRRGHPGGEREVSPMRGLGPSLRGVQDGGLCTGINHNRCQSLPSRRTWPRAPGDCCLGPVVSRGSPGSGAWDARQKSGGGGRVAPWGLSAIRRESGTVCHVERSAARPPAATKNAC